ncbi:MAG TPA: transketolase family protein [Candidatus Brocadiaceae bacterium]|nr:MAG: transketolase [Planctomycetes bacterium GWA2_39_15]
MKLEIKTMRDVFIEEIYNRMHEDKNIFFLSADFGSPKLDKLRVDFKDRFINVGIAEQNLINISTGLALEGFTVYAYAIAPFLTMRAYEQIRNNLSLVSQVKEINVNLIGVGAGFSYDVSGPTHHCLEDITIMGSLPNFIIFSPSDWVLAQWFADYSIKVKKPKYIRFDGKPLSQIYNKPKDLDMAMGLKELKRGEKVCLISTGYMTHRAMKVAGLLNGSNINIGVIDVFLLKPFNEDLFLKLIDKYDCLITLEEAFINKGGLDSLVSCILDRKNSNIRLKRMGIEDTYTFEMGNREHLHKLNKLDDEIVIQTIKDVLDE